MHEIETILERIRSDDRTAVNDLLRSMASFIYRFPTIRRKERIVEGGEFYEYTVSKISDGNRLKNYDPVKGNFYPWFTKVLDNFLHTLVAGKMEQRKTLGTVKISADLIDNDELSHLENLSFDEEKSAARKILSALNDTEKAVAICHMLFYKDIDPWELYFLSEFTGKEISRLSGEIEELLTGELLDEEARIRKESEKIGSLYRFIQHLESQLSEYRLLLDHYKEEEPRYQKTIAEIKKQIQKTEFVIWKKRIKYIRFTRMHRRGKGLVVLKGRKIAELLSVKEGTVTSAVTRIRKKFREEE